MKRSKLTILGLAALAAMSVFVASSAQATGPNIAQFICLEGSSHVHCTGHAVPAPTHDNSQAVHTFSAGFITTTCEVATGEVTTYVNGTSETAPTKPTYENCVGNNTLPIDIHTNGCEYEFHIEEEGGLTEGDFTGSADIVNCENNGSITEIVKEDGSVRCTIHIPEQTTIKPIYFRNMPGSGDVTIEAREATVATTFTPGPGRTLLGGCGVFSEDTHSKYTGNTTVQARNTAGSLIGYEVGLID